MRKRWGAPGRKRQETGRTGHLERTKKSIEEIYQAMEDICYADYNRPPYYHWTLRGVEQKALPAPKPPDGLTPPPERNHMIHHG